MTRVSFDGGSTWSPASGQPHITAGYTSADPSMDWDSEGNLYLCYIDYSPFGTSGKVLVRKSTDGGLSWGAPVEVIDAADDGTEVPVDRPWLVIDRSGGPRDGYQYVTTKPAPWIPFPNRNYLSVSRDNGASFDAWRYIDTIGWQIGDFIQAPMAAPAIGTDGVMHCVYPAWEWTENILPRFVHAASGDGGYGFDYHEMLESAGGDLNVDTSAKTGYQLLSDPSDPEHLAFLFVYRALGDNDIYLLESNNAGVDWSDPLRVNSDPSGTDVMQDLVWGDFDPVGNLIVTWRDRRNAADTGYAVASEIWGAMLYKDSLSFSHDFKISSALAAFDSVLYGNGNDFMGVQLLNDTLYATWGDTRNDYLNIWFSRQAVGASIPSSLVSLSETRVGELHISPNPSHGVITVKGELISMVTLIDEQGKVVYRQEFVPSDEQNLILPPTLHGNYLVAAETAGGIATGKLILLQ